MSARKVSKNPVADRLADALFDKLQNQGAAPETSQDLENLFGAMMGRLLNRMLEGEMDNCLGYKKGQNKRCLSSHLSENLKKFPTLSDLTWIYALRRLTPENSLQLPSQCSAFRSPD